MGIHYDYKSTKGNKLMEKQAKREKKLAEKKAKRLAKEVGVALLNGIICSSIVLIVCFLLYSQIKIGIIVSVSLVTVMLFASLFGTFVPIILNNRRVDPALATGPFITTMNDVIGLFIYFSIAEFII